MENAVIWSNFAKVKNQNYQIIKLTNHQINQLSNEIFRP